MTLVEAALARPPAEREAYLQSACPADPALYEDVRNRIEWEERMGGFLREPIVSHAALASDQERLLGPQSYIALYRITATLVTGGTGIMGSTSDSRTRR